MIYLLEYKSLRKNIVDRTLFGTIFASSLSKKRKWTFLHLNRLKQKRLFLSILLSLQKQKKHLLGMLFLFGVSLFAKFALINKKRPIEYHGARNATQVGTH